MPGPHEPALPSAPKRHGRSFPRLIDAEPVALQPAAGPPGRGGHGLRGGALLQPCEPLPVIGALLPLGVGVGALLLLPVQLLHPLADQVGYGLARIRIPRARAGSGRGRGAAPLEGGEDLLEDAALTFLLIFQRGQPVISPGVRPGLLLLGHWSPFPARARAFRSARVIPAACT